VTTSDDFLASVVVDTREQRPLWDDPEVQRRRLRTGDYSLEGYEDRMAIERKSVADLFGSLGKGRERFLREVRRLHGMPVSGIVVEGNLARINSFDGSKGYRGRMVPSQIIGAIISWFLVNYSVPIMLCDTRRLTEGVVLSWLRIGKTRLDGEGRQTTHDICPVCGGGGPVVHSPMCRVSTKHVGGHP